MSLNQANMVNGPAMLHYGSATSGAPAVVHTETLIKLYCEGAVEVKPVETAAEHRVAGAGVAAQLRENLVTEITGQPVSTWNAVKMILQQLNRTVSSLVCATGTPSGPDLINVPLKVFSLTGVGQLFHRTALTGIPALKMAGGNVVLQGGCTWTAMTKNGSTLVTGSSMRTDSTGESFTVEDEALTPWSKPLTASLYAYDDTGSPLHEFTALSGWTLTPNYSLTPVRDPDNGTVNFRVTAPPTLTVTFDEPDIAATTLHGLLHRTGSGSGIGSGRARYKLGLSHADEEILFFENCFLTAGTRRFDDASAPWGGVEIQCHQQPSDRVLVTITDPS